jgi:hypothetical protein
MTTWFPREEENEGQMAAPTITNPYKHPAPCVELIQSANGSKANNRLPRWIHRFWLVNYPGDAYKESSTAATSALTIGGLLMEVVSKKLKAKLEVKKQK